jgi:hypothetical protein
MKENICVEAGKCCTHSLNETFRSVICHVRFLRGRQVLPHPGKQLFATRPPGEDSHRHLHVANADMAGRTQ